MAGGRPEVHHAAPRCLVSLHERANGLPLDGEGIQAWLEWEWEAMRWRVPVEVSAAELGELIERGTGLIERECHRTLLEGDRRLLGRRGGLSTLRRYGSDWYALLALRRWGRITAEELDAMRGVLR